MTRALLTLLPLAAAAPALAQDGSLLVFDYSGFEDPAFHQPYIDAHGTAPDFAFFGDEQEAFQKLRSGFRADVAHICAGSVSTWAASGLLEPWDTAQVKGWDTINRDLVGNDVIDGTTEVMFVPTDYGSTAIAYNTDDVPAEDVASLHVFQNPAYAGRMTLPDNVDDAYALAYLATGTTDWTEVDDAQFAAASDWLRAVHENLRTYWTDPAELSQLLASGEVQIAWAWNETLPTMTEEGFPIGFAREAEEGSSLWLCGYVKLEGGEGNDALAYDYLNAILDPVSAQPLMDSGFGSANRVGMDRMGEDALVASGLGPIDVPILAQLPLSVELRERQSAEFERIKAGF